MALSSTLMKNLIADGELIISPYSASCLVGNEYELHVKGDITVYEEKYGENDVMDSKGSEDSESIAIPFNGYALEPNRIYHLTLKESITCPLYSCQISPHEDLGQYGLNLNITRADVFNNGATIVVSLTSTHPVVIYKDQAIAKLTLTQSDTGASTVPIGGIIGWRGGKLPYGFCYCDGSNGSPNLMGFILKGGSTPGITVAELCAEYPTVQTVTMCFIMRYK